MRIGWVLGWAVPEAWFGALAKAALPKAEHHFFPATQEGLADLYGSVHFDWIVGYSLGSLLLLNDWCHGITKSELKSKGMAHLRVALLAPIFSFPSEANLGGRVPKAQLRQLSQRLRRDPRGALEGFYRHAGLDVSPGDEPAGEPEDLLWGLQQLEDDRASPPLPPGWRAWCGADDALLDAGRLHALAPAVTILPGATHHPRELITAFAAEVRRGASGGIESDAVASTASFSALGSMRSTSILVSFDRAAPAYIEYAGAQEGLAAWLADWLPEARQGRAVEIGAGPGVFTQRLLPWRGDLVATDISPAMCAAGRRRLPQVPWRTMAAEALEGGLFTTNSCSPSRTWDWIFSSSMLQWLDDPAAVFLAWRRQLAPGGRVLAGLFAAGTLEEWNTLAGETPVRWRTVEDWRALLRASGLRLLRDDTERRVFHHVSAAALLRSLHGAGAAPLRLLSPARLRTRLAEYEQRYRTAEGVPASWCFYRFEAEVA